MIHEIRGEIQAAHGAYQEALHLAQAADYAYGLANTQNNLGRTCGWLRRLVEAEQHLRSAIDFFSHTGRLNKQASAIYNLALVRRLSEEYAAARQPAEEAYKLFERLRESYGIAVSLELLAEIHLGLNEVEQAEALVLRVLAEERTSTQPDGLRTLGEIRLLQGSLAEADRLLNASLQFAEENDDKILQAYAWHALSRLQLAQAKYELAETSVRKAKSLFVLCGLSPL
jgi:tetratricopeptide (TPR) repeat protein